MIFFFKRSLSDEIKERNSVLTKYFVVYVTYNWKRESERTKKNWRTKNFAVKDMPQLESERDKNGSEEERKITFQQHSHNL